MIFSLVSSTVKHFFGRPTVTRMSAMALTACLVATGCSNAENPTALEATSDAKQDAESVTNNAIPDTSSDDNTANTSAMSTQTTEAGTTEAVPVSYDVQNWETDDSKNVTLEDLKDIQKMLGKVTATDDKSLDYASNTAIKYRFMQGEQPYLDIIDSQDYLEFGWYYANPTDSDKEKDISIDHAKKVYKVAHALMGEEGTDLVANMLSGQITRNKQIGDQNVVLAKCEFYSCVLVFDKSDS